jgi:hypothetical protein
MIKIKQEADMKKLIVSIIILTGFLIVPAINNTVFAEETIRDVIAREYQQQKDICPIVKRLVKEGNNSKDITKDITKASIILGHDPCLVIKCGIEAKGNLEEIITGAIEAGTTSDVCSRCAIDVGADPAAVAKIIEIGLGYLVGLSPPLAVAQPGGEDPGGGVVSPSSPSAR